MSTGLIGHVRNYATAGVVSALVGVLSFPIMARNLSVDDYGIMGLITASTTLAVALGKLGLQHAIVRFYAESMHERRGANLLTFNTTVFTLFGALSAVAVIAWLLVGTFVVPRLIEHPSIAAYFAVVAAFIVLRMVGSVTWNMLRARQLSGSVSRATIIGRCTWLASLLVLLATGLFDLYFLLAAFVLAELAAVLYATRAYAPHSSFDRSAFSRTLTARLLRFGWPLMILEALSLVLRLIDRYMIGSVLGEEALGLYSASYNLTSYIEIVVTASLAAAVRPMYTDLWETDGADSTKRFLSSSLHVYLMLGIPFTATFVLVAPDLLVFLASDRYGSGVSIVPWIATIILLDGALIFLSAGMYFLGSTNTVLFWGLVSGAVNFVGNWLVIPRFGIEGAAIVTLVAFGVFCAGFLNRSLRLLSFEISWRKPLVVLVASVVVHALLDRSFHDSALANVAIKGALASGVLGGVLLVVDRPVRDWLGARAGALRARYL